MSRPNTIVCPGEMELAMQLIFTPMIGPDRGSQAALLGRGRPTHRIDAPLARAPLRMADRWIVFGDTIAARERPGLDLANLSNDRDLSNHRVLGFARTMGYHGHVARLVRHVDRVERLR